MIHLPPFTLHRVFRWCARTSNTPAFTTTYCSWPFFHNTLLNTTTPQHHISLQHAIPSAPHASAPSRSETSHPIAADSVSHFSEERSTGLLPIDPNPPNGIRHPQRFWILRMSVRCQRRRPGNRYPPQSFQIILPPHPLLSIPLKTRRHSYKRDLSDTVESSGFFGVMAEYSNILLRVLTGVSKADTGRPTELLKPEFPAVDFTQVPEKWFEKKPMWVDQKVADDGLEDLKSRMASLAEWVRIHHNFLCSVIEYLCPIIIT